MRLALGLATATLLALPAAQAAADTPATVEVTFTDADLVTGGIERPIEVLTVRRGPARGTLIRTRASFVVELLRDAEDI